MSWIALGVGTAVAVGGTVYASNQSKKAGEKAASVDYETDTVLLDDPAQVNPAAVLRSLYGANSKNAENARTQSRDVNRFNYKQALKYYNKILPGFSQLQGQIGQNASAFASGELPSDVQSAITRAAAQQGIQGGFGFGSQGASGGALGNINIRNFGLTSLDLSKYGTSLAMQAGQNAKSLLPNLTGMQDFLLNPQQVLGIAQNNVASQNQFALQNNNLLNQSIAAENQALYNQTQQQYAGDLAQAQMIGQASQSVGGLISGMGTTGGFGGGTAQPSAVNWTNTPPSRMTQMNTLPPRLA